MYKYNIFFENRLNQLITLAILCFCIFCFFIIGSFILWTQTFHIIPKEKPIAQLYVSKKTIRDGVPVFTVELNELLYNNTDESEIIIDTFNSPINQKREFYGDTVNVHAQMLRVPVNTAEPKLKLTHITTQVAGLNPSGVTEWTLRNHSGLFETSVPGSKLLSFAYNIKRIHSVPLYVTDEDALYSVYLRNTSVELIRLDLE